MKLNLKKLLKDPAKPLFILHGLFGSGDNWMSIAKAMKKDYSLYLLDLRNHGESPHSDRMDYLSMAEDVKETILAEGLDHVVMLGHSMGGKVAMAFTLTYPEMVEKLVVADIAPKDYGPPHLAIMQALENLPIDTTTSRHALDQALAENISDTSLRAFLLKSLKKQSSGFTWKLNLPAIKKEAKNIGDWPILKTNYTGPSLFIRGEVSDYIEPEEDLSNIRLLFPQAKLETIAGTGHWLHAQKPAEFLHLLDKFLDE